MSRVCLLSIVQTGLPRQIYTLPLTLSLHSLLLQLTLRTTQPYSAPPGPYRRCRCPHCGRWKAGSLRPHPSIETFSASCILPILQTTDSAVSMTPRTSHSPKSKRTCERNSYMPSRDMVPGNIRRDHLKPKSHQNYQTAMVPIHSLFMLAFF